MSALETILSENFVVVLRNRHCLDCALARETLSKYFPDVCVFDVETMDDGEAVREEVNRVYSHTKVPAIFINSEFVGDNEDLRALEKSGVLKMRIRKWRSSRPNDCPQSPVGALGTF